MKARASLAAIAAVAALAAAPAQSPAAGLRGVEAPPRVSLPGDASAAAVRADRANWIVATRADGDAIARAYGARRIGGRAWLVARDRARALAGALRARGLLDYAEPNRLGRATQAPPPDPLSGVAGWRDAVVRGQVPPPVTPTSPLIGLVDTMIDVNHPEIAGSNIATAGGAALRDFHGTATGTVAAAPANGVGFLGIWPGARVLNLPLPQGERISCADSVRAIGQAIRAGAGVINMSYAAKAICIAEREQILRAVRAGAVPVAAAGNEFAAGNPPEFPASLPHVITVAATRSDDRPAYFSNENLAVDMSAPGVAILAGVPQAFDEDGNADGFGLLDGTSFAAPMVSAAIAWVQAARPDLKPFQAAEAVRLGARDVGGAGYDQSTGFGVLDLAGAMARPTPINDPLEPNDDIRYVDGRAFGSATPPIFGGRPTAFAGTTDYFEDRFDVYRVKIPAHRRVRLALRPMLGDPDLFVLRGSSRDLSSGRVLRSSTRSGAATDRLRIRNKRGRTKRVYVVIAFARGKRPQLLNTGYVLSAR